METLSEQECRILRCCAYSRGGVVLPREELEAAVDSICKHVKELGVLHVAKLDVGEIFLPGRSAMLGSAFSEIPGAVVDLRYGWDLALASVLVDRSAGRRYMQSVQSW